MGTLSSAASLTPHPTRCAQVINNNAANVIQLQSLVVIDAGKENNIVMQRSIIGQLTALRQLSSVEGIDGKLLELNLQYFSL
ncbi:hypothetical protein D5R81_09210 [Parashewanella spongiae]|uniref:Uncharacterized protein n=1 Tax=Parashewanella spongiae TaxID=342950 RepID=A0A3A6TU97_9GAMM|nr:hypothetical protein D5R81_09210 [Parashewanella spongiae]